MFESDKIMFEIYQDKHYNRRFHVIYYTELNEHNKYTEINRAMSGTSYFGGFIKNYRKEEAKEIIEKILSELNEGNLIEPEVIKDMLKEHITD
jgi:hypothetical protein